MSVSVNLAKKLDKAYEDKSLDEILDAPIDALAGITDRHVAQLEEALGIKTIRDLGSNKYVATAVALVELDKHTG